MQWVLHRSKLDLYIIMMVLLPTRQKVPADIQSCTLHDHCQSIESNAPTIQHHGGFVCAAATQWLLHRSKLDLYIIMMVLLPTPQKVPADMQSCTLQNNCQSIDTNAPTIQHHGGFVCAAATQWVLHTSKLDLYIIMMVLLPTPQKVPAGMQSYTLHDHCQSIETNAPSIQHHGGFVPHSSKSSRRRFAQLEHKRNASTHTHTPRSNYYQAGSNYFT